MHSSTSHHTRFIAICLIAAAAFSLMPGKTDAQCGGVGQIGKVTSSGTEFLVCFMQNEESDYSIGRTPEHQDIFLASVSDSFATVRITCKRFPTLNHVVSLPPHGSAVWTVDSAAPIVFPTEGIINSDESIDQTVFVVTSTEAITCYGMNTKQATSDAFLALPINVAGPEYRILSYPNSILTGVEKPSEFCVAAFKDSTKITIIPSAQTRNGSPANVPINYTLNAGECVQIQTDPTTPLSDLTGSVVRVNAPFQPVAVYAGHSRTETPRAYVYPDVPTTSRDHLAEQMPPLTDWGWSYVAKNFAEPTRPIGDIMRVLAATDNTVVKINGAIWCTLMANQFRDTIIDFVNAYVNFDNIATVESDPSHMILVGMIAHSAISSTQQVGDPFLAIVTPLNQTYNDFTYFIANSKEFDPSDHHLIIVTEQSGIGNITIDKGTASAVTPPANVYQNVPIPLNGGNTYYVLTIPQDPGIHRIQASAGNFTILAYGWGPVISYGYTAGALFKPQSGIISLPTPTHSVVPNPGHPALPPPSITVRDITNERVYFDSTKVAYTQNTQNNTVRLKKDIALDVGFMESAEERTLELTTSKPVTEVITGSIRIWYHSAQWFDMYPVDFPFTITPQQAAGVNDQNVQSAYLENYPNPSSGRTTVHFWLPSRANVSVKIYDALGRTVRTVMQGMTNGEETLQVSTYGLPAGDYTLELLAPELGISKHTHVVVIE